MPIERIIRADASGSFGIAPKKHPDCNLDLIHLTAASPHLETMDSVLTAINNFKTSLMALNNDVILALKKEDVCNVKFGRASGKTAVILGLKSVPEDVNVQQLFDAGIRIMQIAYEMPNRFGGGFAIKGAPLTTDGMRLLLEMTKVGMTLDLSHSSHQTAWDALEYIEDNKLKLRVMVSNTGVWEVYNHKRNLTMAHFKKVLHQEGIVGLYGSTFSLHEKDNTINPFITHLIELRKVLPPWAICFGTNSAYETIDVEAQEYNFERLKRNIDPLGNFKTRCPYQANEFNTPRKIDVLSQIIKDRLGKSVSGMEGANLANFLTFALPV